MSQTKVKKLTPEQAAETIKSAYSAIGKKAPEIIWQSVGFLDFGF
ncbi:hypothetical protein QUA41_01530 [Microcoleus sp. Pol11C1]